MTKSELKSQREHDAQMKQLREEFYCAFRIIRTELHAVTPAIEQACWLGFLAGREQHLAAQTLSLLARCK